VIIDTMSVLHYH